MSRKRQLITISFKNEKDLRAAKRKAKRYGWGFSEAIQQFFRDLPEFPPSK